MQTLHWKQYLPDSSRNCVGFPAQTPRRTHCKFLSFLFPSDREMTILAAYMMVKHTPARPLLSPADWITCTEDLEPARNSPSLSQCFRWQRQRCQL